MSSRSASGDQLRLSRVCRTIRTNNPRFYRLHRHQMETICNYPYIEARSHLNLSYLLADVRIYIYGPDAIHTTQAKRRDTYRENKASFKSLHTTRSIATPRLHTPSDAGSRHVECCHPATVYYVYPPTYHECSVRMQGGGGADNTSNPHMYAVPCI